MLRAFIRAVQESIQESRLQHRLAQVQRDRILRRHHQRLRKLRKNKNPRFV